MVPLFGSDEPSWLGTWKTYRWKSTRKANGNGDISVADESEEMQEKFIKYCLGKRDQTLKFTLFYITRKMVLNCKTTYLELIGLFEC